MVKMDLYESLMREQYGDDIKMIVDTDCWPHEWQESIPTRAQLALRLLVDIIVVFADAELNEYMKNRSFPTRTVL